MHVLVTGGAGFIGSHACQRLLRDGHRVVCLDNLFRGRMGALEVLRAGEGGDRFAFVEGEVGDRGVVAGVLEEHGIEAVLHFAAVAYVGESVDDPLGYYRANVAGTIGLLEACAQARGGEGVERVVFSSSCATYGDPPEGMIPVPETCPQRPTSPYGRTKLMCEDVIRDYGVACGRAGRRFGAAMLRYFNVAGCDRAGALGEDHTPETHLIPVAIQAALGVRPGMHIFGTDYPTADGTCVRDYVHVEDLIDAHVRVLERLGTSDEAVEVLAYNVGIGRGYSVREVLDSVRRVSGVDFAVSEGPRRAGDAVALYNDPSKIGRELGWRARIDDLDEIVGSAWRWMSAHPRGYAG
ncbi:MAG: UDP-glucose 4-epimerase GalE [Phycisphaerales bacterium]